jgi:hypothetical protein
MTRHSKGYGLPAGWVLPNNRYVILTYCHLIHQSV